MKHGGGQGEAGKAKNHSPRREEIRLERKLSQKNQLSLSICDIKSPNSLELPIYLIKRKA